MYFGGKRALENLLESFCFKKALPVWVSADECKNDWVSVRNKLNYVSGNVRLNISAETRYFLYVNGKAAVHDGGLFAPDTESAYVDTVDITPMLGVGENVIEILCWHYGNGGRNNVTKPRGYGTMYETILVCKEGGETVMDDGGSTDVGNCFCSVHKFHIIS